MFSLAKSWVTTVTRCTESGTTPTFMTNLEKSHVNKIQRNRKQGEPNKKNGEGLTKVLEESGETPKKEKDLSKIKCYNCGEKGHIYPNCPKTLKVATEDANIKTTWKDEDYKEIEAAMYCTTCDRQEDSIQEVVIDKAVNMMLS